MRNGLKVARLALFITEALVGTRELCVSRRRCNQASSETVVRHHIEVAWPHVLISDASEEVNETQKGQGKQRPHHNLLRQNEKDSDLCLSALEFMDFTLSVKVCWLPTSLTFLLQLGKLTKRTEKLQTSYVFCTSTWCNEHDVINAPFNQTETKQNKLRRKERN